MALVDTKKCQHCRKVAIEHITKTLEVSNGNSYIRRCRQRDFKKYSSQVQGMQALSSFLTAFYEAIRYL